MTDTYTIQDVPLINMPDNRSTAPVAVEHIAPGLVISPALGATRDGKLGFLGGWLVMHARSGYALNGAPNRHHCLDCVREYAEAVAATSIDWTQPQADISAELKAGGDVTGQLREAQRNLSQCLGADCGDMPWASFLQPEPGSPN